MQKLKITPQELRLITKWIKDISGIVLDEKKTYLIENRFSKLLAELKCESFEELYRKVKADGSKRLEQKVIDAITTNETLFFRDSGPFELLKNKIIPELIDKRSKKSSGLFAIRIRIWSAGCSTGQEIYSIAIVLKELLKDTSKYNIRLLGTDISDSAIAQASQGIYNKFEIERGLPKNILQKYFTREGNFWKVKDEIRAMCTFRKLNLMYPFKSIGKFDIIFCRNVAIYFSIEDRKKLFRRLAEVLEKDGYLIIGSTESLTNICPLFVPKRHLRGIYYQLREDVSQPPARMAKTTRTATKKYSLSR